MPHPAHNLMLPKITNFDQILAPFFLYYWDLEISDLYTLKPRYNEPRYNRPQNSEFHNTSTRLIGAAMAKDAWLILFWFLRQFYVIKRQIAAESTFFKFFSIIWKPSQAFYAVAATVALWGTAVRERWNNFEQWGKI